MSRMRIYILAAVAAAGIGLGGTFGASAVPMNGNLVGATAPAPELHKIYYTIDTRADTTGEPTAVATTVAITVATTLATTVATILATTVATTVVISNVVF